MASRRRDLGSLLLVALCVVALFAAGSESHGLEDFGEGKTEATPEMASFFGAKPEAAVLPEALDASKPSKPEAASAMRTTTAGGGVSSAPPRRSVSVAAGVSCGIAALAVVGVAVAVAFVVRARRVGGGARRETEVHLGSL